MMALAYGCLDAMVPAIEDDGMSGGHLLCVLLSNEDGMLELTPLTIEVPGTVSTHFSLSPLYFAASFSLFSVFLLSLSLSLSFSSSAFGDAEGFGICGGARSNIEKFVSDTYSVWPPNWNISAFAISAKCFRFVIWKNIKIKNM